MMNRFYQPLGPIALILLLAACGTTPSEVKTPAPDASKATPAQVSSGKSDAQAFTKPTVPVVSGAVQANLPSGIIRSTNPRQRLSVVEQGRRDPFANVVPVPVAVAGSQATPGVAPRALPKLPPIPNVSTVPIRPTTVPIATTPIQPLSPMPAVVVPPPSPTQMAEAVQVTGVVQMGGRVSAIVKAPDELSSRAVAVGDSLSNGKVRVKRIEARTNAEPIVVLEQNGREVIKPVGSPIASAQ
ncbi:MAG: hypothetical protein SFW36_20835 [Leptolyngbyaceae cyanobacterium bins.59]|nr:hypothetical protein [Leptolyngbyaceae cyanobacterium bins.59]